MEHEIGYVRTNCTTPSVLARVACRFLYLVGGLGPGGLERQLCYLLQSIDRERYRPEVVVWSPSADDIYAPLLQRLQIPLHLFNNRHTAIHKMVAFRRIVHELRPELVLSYSFYTNFAAWWATLGTKTIGIGAGRSDFLYDRQLCGPLLGRLSGRWPNTQIYNSFAGAENSRNSPDLFAPGRVFVVRNGLDLTQFSQFPVPGNGPARIVGLGSLTPVKRWDRLLNAAMYLKKKGLDFIVEIAGSGPLREPLQTQAKALGVFDRVKFTGHVEDVPGFLASSTFLAHTSDTEGCPNVVMEAMACGRTVVAMNAGDIPSLVDDGKTGFVLARGDDVAFSERLVTLITNRDLCRQMGEASRVKAEREFGLQRLVEETINAYRAAGWKDL